MAQKLMIRAKVLGKSRGKSMENFVNQTVGAGKNWAKIYYTRAWLRSFRTPHVV